MTYLLKKVTGICPVSRWPVRLCMYVPMYTYIYTCRYLYQLPVSLVYKSEWTVQMHFASKHTFAADSWHKKYTVFTFVILNAKIIIHLDASKKRRFDKRGQRVFRLISVSVKWRVLFISYVNVNCYTMWVHMPTYALVLYVVHVPCICSYTRVLCV